MSLLMRNGGRITSKTVALALAISVLQGSAAMAFDDGHRLFGRDHWGEYGLGPHFNYRGHGLNDFGYPYFTRWIGHGVAYQVPAYPNGSAGNSDTGYPIYRDFGSFTGGPANPQRFATAVHRAATTGAATPNGPTAGDLTGAAPPSTTPLPNH